MNIKFFLRRVKMFFQDHWIKILVIGIIGGLLFAAYIGLNSLESFYRKMTLATLPIHLLMSGVSAFIFASIYMVMFKGGGSFTKINTKAIKANEIQVNFDDVIGIDEAKNESWEIVELIKDRNKIKKIGGKIIKGLLMVGPPGCGKTLLAKAIATEANIPFISIAGSEFVEVYVGVGASRVRKLFKQARRLAHGHGSCIVFIDELEVIGRGRSFNQAGGQEANSTQNQLLVEMDGLNNTKENIIVIGATNAAEDTLDTALLRPGRFDRKIYISHPSLDGREKIFKYYMEKVKHDPSIDIGRLARQTVYKSPADIENIIKESALIAIRNNKDTVDYKDISAAMERIELGVKHKKSMTVIEREMTAYHETGHLVTTYLLHPTDDVFKASIIARKDSLGVVYRHAKEEYHTRSIEQCMADIQVALGGYVVEKIKYNTSATGIYSDFKSAMRVAHSMVWSFGMADDASIMGDYNTIPKEQLSEKLKNKLNNETEKILNKCYKEVETLLKNEWEIVERFSKELLEKEELEYDDIEAIFKEYGKGDYQIPKKIAPNH